METRLDLYTDYLLSSFGQTTSTGLSNLLDGAISHESLTRFLSDENLCAKDLWLKVKDLVKEHASQDACLIFDDTIIEKPHSDENELICWHFDHSKGRNIKGITMLNAFYHTTSSKAEEPLRVPVAFEWIEKYPSFCELKTRKVKRKSPVTKNE